jgi:hypothetical protein
MLAPSSGAILPHGQLMKSARECNQHAAECDRLAATTDSEQAREAMKAAVRQWHKLAADAEKRGDRMSEPISGAR